MSFLPAEPNFSKAVNVDAFLENILPSDSENFSKVDSIFSFLIDAVVPKTLPPSANTCLRREVSLILCYKYHPFSLMLVGNISVTGLTSGLLIL